jgi:hypothetical protein
MGEYMPTCSYCNETYWFGGIKDGNRHFCNEDCQAYGQLIDIAEQIPADTVANYIHSMRDGNCPVCGGPGPIEVYTSYRVWSALLLTNWSNRPRISCKKCATKAQLGGLAFSSVLGWWGFPWGLIMTPVQIIRNIGGMLSSKDTRAPSPQLVKLLKINLAANVLNQQQRG